MGHPRPRPDGTGPPSPICLGLLDAHSVINDNQILHGDQTRWEKNSYRVHHEWRRAICLR